MMHFVIGGARSGKSGFAQQLTAQAESVSQQPVHYIATATPFDDEMRERITHHQNDRPAHWKTHEAPLLLAEQLRALPDTDIVLIDCLTLWLNNHLYHHPEQDFPALFSALALSMQQRSGTTVVVANEVGLGLIPIGEVNRRFVDLAGRLNQLVAKRADNVTFMAAGLPMILKGNN